MSGIVLCALAFLTTRWAGKRSLGQGLIALMCWGYFFGILRANLLSTFIYFVFDSALIGFYLSQKGLFSSTDKRSAVLRVWCWILIGWPVLLMAMPFQPFLVSLVGLRGSILFLPMMLVGSRLRTEDLRQLTYGFVALNIVALAFAGAEYFMGLQRFYPVNAATALIYDSVDVEGGFYRIPAIFSNSHLYGGAMTVSVPYLIAGWEFAQTRRTRLLLGAGLIAALLGVLLSATRINFVMCCGVVLVTILNGRMSSKKRLMIAVIVLLMAGVAMRNTRFQRFKSLSDTDSVEDRIAGSVNRSFFEILVGYPMGNGLGGGGTSIPYFLEGQVRNPIGMENEYARILCEQGIIGLTLWVSFMVWFISGFRRVFANGPWATGRRLVWSLSIIWFGIGAIGIGMLTALPPAPLFLLGIGWTATRMREESRETQGAGAAPARFPASPYQPLPALGSR